MFVLRSNANGRGSQSLLMVQGLNFKALENLTDAGKVACVARYHLSSDNKQQQDCAEEGKDDDREWKALCRK